MFTVGWVESLSVTVLEAEMCPGNFGLQTVRPGDGPALDPREVRCASGRADDGDDGFDSEQAADANALAGCKRTPEATIE
jgi:hypothetical protein